MYRRILLCLIILISMSGASRAHLYRDYETFANSHLAKDIERAHLVSFGHIETSRGRPTHLAQDPDKLIDHTRYNFLLLKEATLRKGGVKHLTHGTVLPKIPLALYTLAAKASCEDLINDHFKVKFFFLPDCRCPSVAFYDWTLAKEGSFGTTRTIGPVKLYFVATGTRAFSSGIVRTAQIYYIYG